MRVGELPSGAIEAGRRFFLITKYRYLALVVFSAAIIAVFATKIVDVWDFPSAPPRSLLIFSAPEGLTVVPAQ
jgi:hypothetical protein